MGGPDLSKPPTGGCPTSRLLRRGRSLWRYLLSAAVRRIGCYRTRSFGMAYNPHLKNEDPLLSLPKDGALILFLIKSGLPPQTASDL